MESGSAIHKKVVVAGKSGLGLDDVFCKCGEGLTCVITKNKGPDAGKNFFKCGENCCCTIDGEVVAQESKLPAEAGSEAFCKCGEGWGCVITKTEPADAGKGFYDCAGPCKCVVAAS